jgi:hypothetical protein
MTTSTFAVPAENLVKSPPVSGFLQQFGLGKAPGLNLFDTAKNQYQAAQHHAAISQAADADRDTYKQLIRGMATMAGARRGPQFESGIDEASKHIAKLAPHLMTMFPETWDQLHGSRGSAASLASAFAKAHPERTGAENAANAQAVFKNLYGSPGKAPPGGLGAHDLGRLYTGMNRDGLLSAKGGLEPAQLAGRLGHAGTAARSIIDNVAAHGKQAFDIGTALATKLSPPRTETLPSSVDSSGKWKGFKPLSAVQRERFLQTSEINNSPGYFREPPKKPDLLLRMQHPETAYEATQSIKVAVSRWRTAEGLGALARRAMNTDQMKYRAHLAPELAKAFPAGSTRGPSVRGSIETQSKATSAGRELLDDHSNTTGLRDLLKSYSRRGYGDIGRTEMGRHNVSPLNPRGPDATRENEILRWSENKPKGGTGMRFDIHTHAAMDAQRARTASAQAKIGLKHTVLPDRRGPIQETQFPTSSSLMSAPPSAAAPVPPVVDVNPRPVPPPPSTNSGVPSAWERFGLPAAATAATGVLGYGAHRMLSPSAQSKE